MSHEIPDQISGVTYFLDATVADVSRQGGWFCLGHRPKRQTTIRLKPRGLPLAVLLVAALVTGCGPVTTPSDSTGDLKVTGNWTTTSTVPDSQFDDAQEPPVPVVGGSGLPDLPGDANDVDCDNAEELCESGEWACDDIADYCDIGPDGGELPDEFDWDS